LNVKAPFASVTAVWSPPVSRGELRVTTTPATGDLLAVSIATPVMLESADAASVGGVGGVGGVGVLGDPGAAPAGCCWASAGCASEVNATRSRGTVYVRFKLPSSG
jgi:hypothetical protein